MKNDDPRLMKKLMDENRIITVKENGRDADDKYMIELARRHNSYIVTNDKFRDFYNDSSKYRFRYIYS